MKRLIQTQIESDSQKLETATDVKFQNIIYYYWDGKKTVKQNQQVKIDFLGAVSEMKNLDKGITEFSKLVQSFGGSMDQLTREIDSQTSKDNDNLDSVWGKSENSVPIWSTSENSFDSQSQHKANLEKIWGKKK